MTALLNEAQITSQLSDLPGWTREGTELVGVFVFKQYLDGVAFAGRVGEAAEAANHHPEMLIGWRKVTVRVSTHSAGGLTELDFALARRANELAGE
ncbi:4a-hydroxytetrahydrobiopterin dehydratase [Phragmitibacter flavus]|uniref:Putative pterin-4-alpha-carbinolamine dehydratase n=1 Tax=Phragmitibacter flavus TaxID=2576071 RepID=A0A5R8KI90_9BACT|nr:4a-hydroxytetrahydrobiopterin dehydratase [Phragmitibacter flavus]TLD72034.1 4a-hydroxytetrahydrobiopterin dehydratase [Phragmitibacter flavus]